MNGQAERPDDELIEVTDAETGAPEAGAADPAEAALAEAQAKANENWERYLRAAAELKILASGRPVTSRMRTSLHSSRSGRNCWQFATPWNWAWRRRKTRASRACWRAALRR